MSEDLLKKKKRVVSIQTPEFRHDEKDITAAIGVDGLIQSVSNKMNVLSTNQEITPPSRMVEYFYNNFSLIELAFMAMHSIGYSRREEEEKGDDEPTPFEEVI